MSNYITTFQIYPNILQFGMSWWLWGICWGRNKQARPTIHAMVIFESKGWMQLGHCCSVARFCKWHLKLKMQEKSSTFPSNQRKLNLFCQKNGSMGPPGAEFYPTDVHKWRVMKTTSLRFCSTNALCQWVANRAALHIGNSTATALNRMRLYGWIGPRQKIRYTVIIPNQCFPLPVPIYSSILYRQSHDLLEPFPHFPRLFLHWVSGGTFAEYAQFCALCVAAVSVYKGGNVEEHGLEELYIRKRWCIPAHPFKTNLKKPCSFTVFRHLCTSPKKCINFRPYNRQTACHRWFLVIYNPHVPKGLRFARVFHLRLLHGVNMVRRSCKNCGYMQWDSGFRFML